MSQIPIYLMESFKFGISRFDGGGGGGKGNSQKSPLEVRVGTFSGKML